jgi:tetratricopeptide (TPR) repeat protein
MPLKDFFQDQQDELLLFLHLPWQTLHVVRHEPDLKPVLRRLLVALDEHDDNPHVLVVTQVPFHDARQFFTAALEDLVAQNEHWRTDLEAAGVRLPEPQGPDAQLAPVERLAHYVSAVADALPDEVGAYAVLIDPEIVTQETAFRRAMEELVLQTTAAWAKFIVLDRRQNPILGDLDPRLEVSTQLFHLEPAQIEEAVTIDLKRGDLPPNERRQYTAMSGAFAAAHRNYAEAERLQREALGLAQADGSPAEQANAWYNLGNTCLSQKKFAEAEECFGQSGQLCLDHGVQPLLAMSLTNLGVALQRQARSEAALQSFVLARRTFRAMNNPPGEAHVLDCQASVLALDQRNSEAEAAWQEALAIYDGITAPTLQDVRDGGRRLILDHLTHFYESTGQKQKVRSLPA